MRIIAINGSTRTQSTNGQLLHAIAALYADTFELEIFNGLTGIPHFNPDLDNDTPPEAVAAFRKLIKDADGVLICTPEYAMGVPGSLKNALDWTVSSTVFSQKPTALITASSVGQKGHAALMETLLVIECAVPETSTLVIPFVKTKIKDNTISDTTTLAQVKDVINSLIHTVKTRQ
jgi:chromate reductase, NAD(P)H dehydrogenase (quinone)